MDEEELDHIFLLLAILHQHQSFRSLISAFERDDRIDQSFHGDYLL